MLPGSFLSGDTAADVWTYCGLARAFQVSKFLPSLLYLLFNVFFFFPLICQFSILMSENKSRVRNARMFVISMKLHLKYYLLN